MECGSVSGGRGCEVGLGVWCGRARGLQELGPACERRARRTQLCAGVQSGVLWGTRHMRVDRGMWWWDLRVVGSGGGRAMHGLRRGC